MYYVVHLIHVFFFNLNEKGLLNFISEKIMLVYRINLLGTAFKKRLSFKLLVPQFIVHPNTQSHKSTKIHTPWSFFLFFKIAHNKYITKHNKMTKQNFFGWTQLSLDNFDWSKQDKFIIKTKSCPLFEDQNRLNTQYKNIIVKRERT